MTSASNAKLGIQYAKDQGYTSAVSTYETGSTGILHNSIKAEINAARPVLVGISASGSGHAVVAYGYSSDTTSKMIRVNYGGGRSGTIRVSSSPVTNVSSYNADVNVNSVSLTNGTASSSATITFGIISSITRIKVGG